MKLISAFATVLLTFASSGLQGQNLDQLRKMEASGDVAGARAALAHAVDSDPASVTALTDYAEFLERYGDPAGAEAYTRLLTALRRSGDTVRAAAIAKRIALLDLMAGGGDRPAPAPADASQTAPIPGPLRSFARMSAIAGDATPDDVLPALARNVVTNGYQASHSNEALEQTEYLKLVHRYLSQAQELEKLAGDSKVIKIENCDSPAVGELLRVLGFRIRGGCGSEVVLETVNAARAFLTTDSGFPINVLEESLRTNRPFTYDFHPARADVLFGPEYWEGGNKGIDPSGFVDFFVCTWAFPSWTPKPPRTFTKPSRLITSKPTPTYSISSAACSKSAAARRWCPAERAPLRSGASWLAPHPITGRSSSISCWPKTMAGWPAFTIPSRASTALCRTTCSNPSA
jgi:hypothetical protein